MRISISTSTIMQLLPKYKYPSHINLKSHTISFEITKLFTKIIDNIQDRYCKRQHTNGTKGLVLGNSWNKQEVYMLMIFLLFRSPPIRCMKEDNKPPFIDQYCLLSFAFLFVACSTYHIETSQTHITCKHMKSSQ